MKMKMTELATMFVAAALFVCCSKMNIEDSPVDTTVSDEGTEFVLNLVQTKTVNDGFGTRWTEGDLVNVFHAEAGTTDYINDGAFEYNGGNAFRGVIREKLESGKKYDWYVAYPYDKTMLSPKAMPIHVPGDQYQSADGDMSHLAGSYCPLSGKALSVAGNSSIVVEMRHLVTVLKIKVTNYEQNPMNLNLVSFRADGATHVNESVTIINGDAPTIAGSFNVDITSDGLSYTQVDRGMGLGGSRPLLHLKTPVTLGLNESATVYMVTLPFYIANGTAYTIGMNNNQGGVTMSLYGKNIAFKAGQICGIRQGSRLEPPFKDGINFYHGQKLSDGTYQFEDGWWRCDLPENCQFAHEFDFADLFYSCNTGDASVSLLSIGNQNDKAGNDGVTPSEAGVARFNELAASCKGFKWVRNARFGYNFDVGYGDKCGLFFSCYAGYNVGRWNIWFRMEKDPFDGLVKAVDGDWLLETSPTINGGALWGNKFAAPTAVYGAIAAGTEVNICQFLNGNPTSWDQGMFDLFYPNWRNFVVKSAAGEMLILNDGTNVVLTDYAKKFCQHSRGIEWQPAWYQGFDKNSGENGEYTEEGIWNGGTNDNGPVPSAAAAAAAHGISITTDGRLVTSPEYDGFGFRFAPSLYFEYDYGYAQHLGTKYLPFIVGNI